MRDLHSCDGTLLADWVDRCENGALYNVRWVGKDGGWTKVCGDCVGLAIQAAMDDLEDTRRYGTVIVQRLRAKGGRRVVAVA